MFGPKSGVHSGNYGNWMPNPAMRLAALLASMKDDTGRVLVATPEEPPLAMLLGNVADKQVPRAESGGEK